MSTSSYLDNKPLEREALEVLSNIKDEMINAIPEKIFVARYLPMLANKTGNVDLREWIEIAGHVYNKVNVIDESGKILFSVPPLLKRPGTKKHQYAQQSVQEIVELSKLHARNNPKMGERILTDGLKTTINPFEPIKEDDELWDSILERYNFKTPVPDKPITELLDKKPIIESNDDDGYEVA